MYPRIPWELVMDPLGSAEHTLGPTGLWSFRRASVCLSCCFDPVSSMCWIIPIAIL